MYEYPTSRFVADFLGDVNVLEARVVEAGRDQVRVHSAQAGCDIVADRGEALGRRRDGLGRDPAGEVRAVARSRRRPAPPNCMAGEVWDIGYLGDVSIYHVRLASGAVVRCTQANRARLIERPITWEDRVFLSWGADASVILKS